MAHSKSAKKRIRQNAKRRARNRWRKDQVKEVIKGFDEAVRQGDATKATEQFRLCTKKLDRYAAKSTLHKKTVARKKSRLAKTLNKLSGAAAS